MFCLVIRMEYKRKQDSLLVLDNEGNCLLDKDLMGYRYSRRIGMACIQYVKGRRRSNSRLMRVPWS